MKLNAIKPAVGSRVDAKRVGRGSGSGTGKTCGRGHKGQKSRTGSGNKVGFEGGQMPIQRRLPKVGFRSRKSLATQQIRVGALDRVESKTVDLSALKAAGLIRGGTTTARVFHGGNITKPVVVKGLHVSRGARAAIEAAGGKVED